MFVFKNGRCVHRAACSEGQLSDIRFSISKTAVRDQVSRFDCEQLV